MTDCFDSDGIEIAYEVVGEGTPVVLIHGFASNRQTNWEAPGWYDVLNDAGFQVIAYDGRGHGESGKPHAPSAYGDALMAMDAVHLLDHLKIERAHFFGYSMGAYVTTHLLGHHEERCLSGVLGGIGEHSAVGTIGDPDYLAKAFEAESRKALDDPMLRAYRHFADRLGQDLEAMAACISQARLPFDADRLSAVQVPVLIVTGEKDKRMGRPEPLAAMFANGEAVCVKRRDHMTTVGDKETKAAVANFLQSHSRISPD